MSTVSAIFRVRPDSQEVSGNDPRHHMVLNFLVHGVPTGILVGDTVEFTDIFVTIKSRTWQLVQGSKERRLVLGCIAGGLYFLHPNVREDHRTKMGDNEYWLKERNW